MNRRLTIACVLAGTISCVLLAHQSVAAQLPEGEFASVGIGGSDISFATLSQLTTSKTSDLMLLGPAEAIDHYSASFEVLGQTVRLSGSAAALNSLRRTLRRLIPGSVVAVRGRLTAAGEIEATSIAIGSQPYVEGAQPVFLRGVVRVVDRSVGKLVIGRLVVDYTGALHSLDPLSVLVGVEFAATGIRASADGSFLALSAATRGIGGSDPSATGIGGSDPSAIGIGGSDPSATGFGGSDPNAIGIGGSDLSATGIGGSDPSAIGIGGSDF